MVHFPVLLAVTTMGSFRKSTGTLTFIPDEHFN